MIRRILLTATVLAAATIAVVLPGSPAQASACPIRDECFTTFYSSPAHTTVVGTLAEFCGGGSSMTGVRSGYFVTSRESC